MNDTLTIPITQFTKLAFIDYASIDEVLHLCQTKTQVDISSKTSRIPIIRKNCSIVSIQFDRDINEIPTRKDFYDSIGMVFDEESSLRPIYAIFDKSSGRYINPTANGYTFSGKRIDRSLFRWTLYDMQDITSIVSNVLTDIVAENCLSQTFNIAIRWLWSYTKSDLPLKHPDHLHKSHKIIDNIEINGANFLVAEALETNVYKLFYADILPSGQIFINHDNDWIKAERQKLISFRMLE